jgi:glutathione S-transferase
MSDIVVYGVPGSPFVRAVQMGLEEKKAAYRMQVVGVGESKGEAYLKKHPFGGLSCCGAGGGALAGL